MNQIIQEITSKTKHSIYFHSAETKSSQCFDNIYLEFEVSAYDVYLLSYCRSISALFDCHIYNNEVMLFRIMIQKGKLPL